MSRHYPVDLDDLGEPEDIDEEAVELNESMQPLATALSGNRPAGIPRLGELIERIIEKWGGADAFAAAYYETFQAAGVGSAAKARLLEKLMVFMQAWFQMHGEAEDVTNMTDEELKQALQSASQKAAGK